MRITFCWSHLSGYAAACFRALAGMPQVSLHVVALRASQRAPFDDARLGGFALTLLEESDHRDHERVRRAALREHPDVLVVSGWWSRAYRRLVAPARGSGTRLILAADTPARFGWRQRLAPLRIGRYLRSFDAVVVPGERGYQVMRYWRVPHDRIWKGLYGIDGASLAPLWKRRAESSQGWPRRFIFVGRLAPEKGLTTLLAAFRDYRRSVSDPWPLAVLGTGPLASAMAGEVGVEAPGFVQPADLGEWLVRGGVFVLPSWDDPWPLALVEAAAAGLPLLCTDACGSSAELVTDLHTGLVVPARSPERLAEGLRWFHENAGHLPAMGAAAGAAAAAYDSSLWARRWLRIAAGGGPLAMPPGHAEGT